MVFKIDGFDIVPYIGEGGLKWQNNGVDGPDTGRTMDGLMQRDLVGYKARVDVECLWMSKDTAYMLHQYISPKFVTVVTDTCPWKAGTVSMEMYSNNAKQTCVTEYGDGTKLYADLSFPLIER